MGAKPRSALTAAWMAVAGMAVSTSAFAGSNAVAEPKSEEPTWAERSRAGLETTTDAAAPSESSAGPFRASRAWGAPSWLDFGLTHRARYEALWNQFRVGLPGDDQGIALRTTAWAEFRLSQMAFRVEGADSRFYFAREEVLNDSLINPLTLLEALGRFSLSSPRGRATTTVRLGRMTLDLGSRRLAARNGYRNTINSFTGVDVAWKEGERKSLRAFGLLPVDRKPDDPEALQAHRVEWSGESLGVRFFGIHGRIASSMDRLSLESYVLGLVESDRPGEPTRNRRFVTPGLRLVRSRAPGDWDAELEVAAQMGSVRASTEPQDDSNLQHLAGFTHAALGIAVDVPGEPHLELFYDYASGDSDPNDRQSGRFDTLYGARRFDFGPTSLYGALARANISSPGVALDLAPARGVNASAAYRAVWLASARDAWTTAGLRDPSGQSGRFVGHQLDASVRLQPGPGNVAFEVGAVHTWLGPFVRGASGTSTPGDPSYLYVQVSCQL